MLRVIFISVLVFGEVFSSFHDSHGHPCNVNGYPCDDGYQGDRPFYGNVPNPTGRNGPNPSFVPQTPYYPYPHGYFPYGNGCVGGCNFQGDFSNLECPHIDSCSKLVNDHPRSKQCKSDEDCLRKEKCCSHPCDESTPAGYPKKLCMVATKKGPRQNYGYAPMPFYGY